jgi:hypothetical protein
LSSVIGSSRTRTPVAWCTAFDTAAAVPTQAVPAALPPPSDVRVRATRWEPERIDLVLDRPAPAGSALLVSENYYPGWEALVDGRAVPTGRAQYTLIGVVLPPGARSVQLSFRSAVFERGKMITLASLATATILLLAGAAAGRRRRG